VHLMYWLKGEGFHISSMILLKKQVPVIGALHTLCIALSPSLYSDEPQAQTDVYMFSHKSLVVSPPGRHQRRTLLVQPRTRTFAQLPPFLMIIS